MTKKAKRVKHMYLTLGDKKAIIIECGDAAAILLDYYYSKIGVPDFKHTDKKASFALGWSERKAKDIRLKLIRANYIYQETTKSNRGRKIITTYLGRAAVREVISCTALEEKTEEYFTQLLEIPNDIADIEEDVVYASS